MRSLFFAASLAPHAAADFAKVIGQCETWLTESEKTKKDEADTLTTETTNYGTLSTGLKKDIATLESDLAEAQAKAEAAAEATAIAEEKKAKQEADLGNNKNMLDASISGCESSKKQLGDEIAALDIPVGQLTSLLDELSGNAGATAVLGENLSANAKATLTQTIGALQSKLNADKLEKENLLAAAQTNCAKTKTELEGLIADLTDTLIPATQAEIKLQSDANKAATTDASEAQGDLAAKQKELSVATTDFQALSKELKESIQEAKDRVAALTQVIAILNDVDRNNAFVQVASFLQQGAVTAPGFLKMQDASKTKPLLDLISKYTKRSEVRTLLTAAASSSRQSVDAFKKVHAMINELIDRLTKQNMADEDSKTWCAKTENELTKIIADLEKALQSATDEKAAADALVQSHKDTISTAKQDIDDDRASKVSTHETDLQEIKVAKKNKMDTENELQGIKQAIITITEAPIQEEFKNEVVNMVKELKVETEAQLRTDKDIIMTEEKELEDHAKDFDQKIAASKTKLEKAVMAMEQKSAESLNLADKMRALKSELGTNEGEFHTIFEDAKGGKCYEYDAVYTQRLVDRKAELAELGDAKDALISYTKSIGIRFM